MPTDTSDFPLASETPLPGDAGTTTAPGVGSGSDAGASGSSSSYGMTLSTGGLVAIVVVVVLIAILGATTATLFFIAKKREWTMRETLRHSAKKVKTALTPRRSEFPSHLKDPQERGGRKGRARIADDVPPTPRLNPEDIEKGLAKASTKDKVSKLGKK